MTFRKVILGGIGLGWAMLGPAWARDARAQATAGATPGASQFTVQPMLVPMMTTNGQTTPMNPYLALSNPLYNPYATGTAGQQTGLTNQQMGLLMLSTSSRMSGLGSGQISGTRPNPNAPGAKSAQAKGLAGGDQDASPVRRATQPTSGVASRYFSRQSPSQTHEPKGRFARQSKYFP